ncbi:BZ3500_MvSof-1268-A1-R1_Chr11-2g03353 [Microbotryum saponariae]|uniref:BZ3500_MvSof-1268-A1-R1_Chr11-2g03353 protein n=1 Tax=Microbotryum saponariae TaxID=289078 RepID=A0A2X0KTZ1_9BASI|nr:BZ3500_MvSof-1268-A1-R1_Chr11-2g03353 [Microbotryum saponariae]SDA03188.1 BZ3501_MvSof-1269-A2-R1_Chr11g02924 [Microbotryum saponariae]
MVNAPSPPKGASKLGYEVLNKTFPPVSLVRLRHVILTWSRSLVTQDNAAWFEHNLSFDDLLSSPLARNGRITLYVEKDLKYRHHPPKIYISKAQFEILTRWIVEDEAVPVEICKAMSLKRQSLPTSKLGPIEARVYDDPKALREFVHSEAAAEDITSPSNKQRLMLAGEQVGPRKAQKSTSPPPDSASTPSTPPATSPEVTSEPSRKKVKLAKVSSTSTLTVETSRIASPPHPSAAVPLAPLPPVFDLDECSVELAELRARYAHAKRYGGAAFLSLDVETWERGHDALLEVGWTCVDFTAPSSSSSSSLESDSDSDMGTASESEGEEVPAAPTEWATVTRTDQHVVIAENITRRNGRFSPDARDDWDFGPSSRSGSVEPTEMTLPASKKAKADKESKSKSKSKYKQTIKVPAVVKTDSLLMGLDNLYALLAATFENITSSEKDKQLFLIFHDPRMDLKALGMLGFEDGFAKPVKELAVQAKTGDKGEGEGEGNVWIIDTQRVYAGWKGFEHRKRLERCCSELEVATKRLHNAGNDAHYTLDLFERMMDPQRKPVSDPFT